MRKFVWYGLSLLDARFINLLFKIFINSIIKELLFALSDHLCWAFRKVLADFVAKNYRFAISERYCSIAVFKIRLFRNSTFLN